MKQLLLHPEEKKEDPSLKFVSPADLAYYIERVSGTHVFSAEFRSSRVLNAHFDKAALVVDKYFPCVDPTRQLEYIFESMGVFDYDTYFEGGKEFNHLICEHTNDETGEKHVSEVFRQNVKGDRLNPYMRYLSSKSCGSQQCSKLMLLAGIHSYDLEYEREPVFVDFTLTYPSEVDVLLLDPSKRDKVISRMQKCYRRFFKMYSAEFGLSDDRYLGASQSLHLWSSTAPFLPNAHHHVLTTHFSYSKVDLNSRLDIDVNNVDLYSEIESCIVKTYPESNNFKHRDYTPEVDGVVFAAPDRQFKPERVLVDREHYDGVLVDLSTRLRSSLGFESLRWYSDRVPVHAARIRWLWSECVKHVFKDFFKFGEEMLFDVHVNFIPVSQRERLLHKLQYKTRPPVLDLDLFFRKAEGIITGYDEFDINAAISHLRSCFVSAALADNVPAARRYESLLNKAEKLSDVSESDWVEWCKFLCFWVTDTRVYGCWRRLKWFMLDRLVDPVLVYDRICPVCGGRLTPVRHVSRICIDSIIVRTSSGFHVYDLVGGDG